MEDKTDTFDLVGRTLAEKYRVERVVARGGFGAVYHARHIELDTPVALKVLMVPDRFKDDLRAEFLEMFRLEARTIASLAHPAIVRVIDYGSARFASGETPWMALEWLEGRTLEADLAGRPADAGRSPREALDLLRPAFDALSCAHEAGIAHRDIKPANLMIVKARRGAAGLRMLDFGIAKVMEVGEQAGSGETATKTGISSYSLYYAAPEQLGHARTGPWTDVHAMALILVELLTGRRAYRAADDVTIYADILDRERPTPGRIGVDVGPWEPVLARALALRPMERYADADALLAALDASLDPAEVAWRSGRSLASLAAATLPAVPAPGAPRDVASDTLSGASAVVRLPTRSRWFVPVVAGLGLSLVALGVHTATRSAAASGVVQRPAAGLERPSAPAPVERPEVDAATPAAVIAITPPPARADAASVDMVERRPVHRGRPRREPGVSAPGSTAASRGPTPSAAVPATAPVIVIE